MQIGKANRLAEDCHREDSLLAQVPRGGVCRAREARAGKHQGPSEGRRCEKRPELFLWFPREGIDKAGEAGLGWAILDIAMCSGAWGLSLP